MNQLEISHASILAAVLYGAGHTTTLKVKPDDAPGEMEVTVPIVNIDHEENAVVLTMKMKDVMPFVKDTYLMNCAIAGPGENGALVVVFEKEEKKPMLLGANGNQVHKQSDLMSRVLASFK